MIEHYFYPEFSKNLPRRTPRIEQFSFREYSQNPDAPLISTTLEDRTSSDGSRGRSRRPIEIESLKVFNNTELYKSLDQLLHDQAPFKYRCLSYVKKMLHSPEVEEDAREFRKGAHRVPWQHEEMIMKDIVRTRLLKHQDNLHLDTKVVLEFYCQQKNASYAQGMIEVLLPFLLMKQQTEPAAHWSTPNLATLVFDLPYVYAYFKRFVELYIPNTLHTKFDGKGNSLPYLKCSIFLTELLLNYHDKQLAAHLKAKHVAFEMFATEWLMILFARCFTERSYALVYELWEIFLFERDRYFVFFFALALIVKARKRILEAKTFEECLLAVTKGTEMSSMSDLQVVYYEAVQIRANTPYSFEILASKFGLFERNPIVSNEELAVIESFRGTDIMPTYSKDIISGSQGSNNNNKALNALFLNEEEEQTYLCGKSCERKKLYDPIVKINALKYSFAKEIMIGANVRFRYLDLRDGKKPQIPTAVELDCDMEDQAIKDALLLLKKEKGHLVIVTSRNKEEELSEEERSLLKLARHYLKDRNYVSLL